MTGNPKGKIAWKFREEEATPRVKDIEWQTGRTGKIVGVAIFDGVRLAGTNVTRATLHNAGFMRRNKIAIESELTRSLKSQSYYVGGIAYKEPILTSIIRKCCDRT